jgi:hypothetical protein
MRNADKESTSSVSLGVIWLRNTWGPSAGIHPVPVSSLKFKVALGEGLFRPWWLWFENCSRLLYSPGVIQSRISGMKEPDADSLTEEPLLDDQMHRMWLLDHWRRPALSNSYQPLIESSVKRIAESRELLAKIDKLIAK